jgi:hypothetical protein
MFRKSQVDFEIPDEGSYILKMLGIASSHTHPPKKPGDPEDVSHNFQFVIDDPDTDWDGVEVRSWFPERYTDKNKTGLLFQAILGGGEIPEELELEDLLNKPFRATIRHEVSTKNGNTYAKVESPIAIRSKGAGRRRGQAELPVTPVDDDDEPPF